MADLLDKLADQLLVSDGCWEWTGALNGGGYGNLGVDGRMIGAHRAVYELLVGPIPDGLDLDHQCHNDDPTCPGGKACAHRRCANPAHLIPRTRSANLAAAPNSEATRTHCPQGHPYDEVNTYWHRGKRQCKACRTRRDRQRRD